MTSKWDTIIKRFDDGDTAGAKDDLVALLVAEPQNNEAWELVTTLFPDPTQQADCCRQILLIDPLNRQAANRLLVLTSQFPITSYQQPPSDNEEMVLECKQCGAPMETHFAGELQDKRAICSYCGMEIDLPDAFKRVQKKKEHQQLSWGSRTVEETIVETGLDSQVQSEHFESLPSDVQELLLILKEKGTGALDESHLRKLQEHGIKISFESGAFDPETLQALRERGLDQYPGMPISNAAKTVVRETGYEVNPPPRFPFFFRKREKRKPRFLSIDEIISLAGEPLSPDKRRDCPNPRCGAVISKSDKKCPWCGKAI